MPACRSRGPGTSPRRTGCSTAAGARPPASAGRPRTASPSRTCPRRPTGDLFEFAADARPADPDALVDADGHLRGDHEEWLRDPRHLRGLGAGGARDGAPAARRARRRRSVRLVGTVLLGVGGRGAVPRAAARRAADRPGAHRAAARRRRRAAARPTDAEEAASRRARDALVLRHVPGRESTDLRNPAQVREMLAAVGVDVPNTRKWVLEPYRTVHPVVDALLDWRRDERIATTYGYRWLDAHVGPDDRLRGRWTACDGAAGRMTAENGLHNLPAALRPGVAAHAGHVFVRADLGQIEPRVLAVVSGDAAFAAATRADDLYAPVAQRLGVERPVAKVAVLAAMYGQRSGAAGEALKGLERAYPVAMALLDRALRRRAARRAAAHVRRAAHPDRPVPRRRARSGADPALDAARGRFARNAIIQGAAAELFKAWAATVRATTRDLGAAGRALPARRAARARAGRARRRGGGAGRPGARRRLPALGRRRAGAVRRRHLGHRPVVRRQGLTRAAGGCPGASGRTAARGDRTRERFRCGGEGLRDRAGRSGRRSGLVVVVDGAQEVLEVRAELVGRGDLRGLGGEQARPLLALEVGVVLLLERRDDRAGLVVAVDLGGDGLLVGAGPHRRGRRSGRLSPVTSTMALSEASAPSAHSDPAR